MLTRCPNCQTLFRISENQLRSARGKTRCGQCFTIFEAQEAIVEEQGQKTRNPNVAPAPAPSQPAPINTGTQTPGRSMGDAASSIYNELVIKNRTVKYDIPDSLDDENNSAPISANTAPAPQYNPEPDHSLMASQSFQTPEPVISPETQLAEVQPESNRNLAQRLRSNFRNPLARRPETQDFNLVPDVLQDDLYEDVHVPSAKKNFFLILSILILLFLLSFQYIYFKRSSLAQNETIRPKLVKFCKVFNCTIPFKKDLKKIRSLTFAYDKHSSKKGIGVIRSRFVNMANHRQPYPILVIRVRNKVDAVVAMRRIKPKDYLKNPENITNGMEPKNPIDIRLEFEIPSKEDPSVWLAFE